MRRPVKPFVTEYKAPNRRSQASSGPSPRRLKEDQTTAAPANDGYYRNGDNGGYGGNHGEDAYEAAMRAADALFSPSPRKAPAAPSASPSQAVEDDGMAESEIDPKSGGRVLRVIDEAPSPELVALDIERAPKRRGRKPGSKNKPKIAPVDLAAETRARAYGQERVHLQEDDDADDDHEIVEVPNARADADEPVAIAARQVPPQAARNAPPFAWVKRKLAPGEQWKRRLPKVCW